jgi:hypothetical protein
VQAPLPVQRGRAQNAHMDELTARIEALLLRYWATFERRVATVDAIVERFHDDIKILIAEFGQAAVDAALDAIPNDPPPSFSMH